MITRKVLGSTNPDLLLVSKMQGSSNATTFVTKGIYKVGAESDFGALFDLKSQLGNQFSLIFSGFEVISRDENAVTVQLEYVGDTNLEDVCLSEVEAGCISEIVKQVIASLELLMGSRAPAENPSTDIAAIKEAFDRNAMNAGISPDLSIRNDSFVETPVHNDLTATNIMIDKDGKVRFIDPRMTIPGSTVGNKSRGCPAIDHAALYVSLYRKDLERKKLGLSSIHDSIEIIEEFVRRQIANGFYSASLYAACVATCYSVYAACACTYCTAPERRWLWEEMKQQTVRWQEVLCESNHG